MIVRTTEIEDLLLIEPRIHADQRGYFFESYHSDRYKEAGIPVSFVQDNESKSVRGVVRGLHYQLEPYSQAKLVRVIDGEVFDVAVDIRKGSPTFGRWFGVLLSGSNKLQMYILEGFAHGFSVLSESAVFSYKCSSPYNAGAERCIFLSDPDLAIDWKLGNYEMIISEKDKMAPVLRNAEMNFIFRQ